MPTFFLVGLSGGFILSLINPAFLTFYIFSLLIYISVVFLNAYQEEQLKLTLYVALAIFLTHIYYGFFFILGLVRSKLDEEKEDL